MNPTIKKTGILTLTGVLLVAIIIGTGSGFTNLAAVPHQLPTSPSKSLTSTQEKSAAVSTFELDNPLIETDEGIVPARKCAVCIGVSDLLFEFVSLVQKMMCCFSLQ